MRFAQFVLQGVGDENFRGRETCEFALELLGAHLFGAKVTVREREPHEPVARVGRLARAAALAFGRANGKQNGIGLLGQQRRFCERARRNDARDLALHRAVFLRLPDLLGNHDALAHAHEARDVLVERDHRNARHRNRLLVEGLAALGERDPDQSIGLHGVVEERFVEVAHSVENERIGILALDFDKLTQRRRHEAFVWEARGEFADGVFAFGFSRFLHLLRFLARLVQLRGIRAKKRPSGGRTVCGGDQAPLGKGASRCRLIRRRPCASWTS